MPVLPLDLMGLAAALTMSCFVTCLVLCIKHQTIKTIEGGAERVVKQDTTAAPDVCYSEI